MNFRRALSRSFYDRPVADVAVELLGKLLVRSVDQQVTVGRIVEVEAYLPNGDPACHAARGKTPGNAMMFGPPGHSYVYPIHSRWCFNAVTEAEGNGCAVLVRALQPVAGRDVMEERRGRSKDREVACGPGRLCEAMSIERELNGSDLTKRESLWISPGDLEQDEEIFTSPRIGVTSAEEMQLRFCIAGNSFVSGTKAQRGM